MSVLVLEKVFESFRLGDEVLTDQRFDIGAESWVSDQKETAVRDTVGLIVEFLRILLIKIVESLFLQDLRV